MAFFVLDVGPTGPLIQVGVSVGAKSAQAGLGGAPRSYTALIDTGASGSAISPKVVGEIQPKLVRRVPVERAGAKVVADVYAVRIKLAHHLQPGRWYELEAVEIAPASPGVNVLIGRDLLENTTLLYDGSNGKLVLMDGRP
jgi:predicted aspartyl protease